jgi:AcrR family transcriptional regulator
MRTRILAAAVKLLINGGRDAVTTRAVAEAAGVQAPTLYRLFGDKNALLDAVAEHGFTTYSVEKKLRNPDGDPVEGLRTGWDRHIEFGLSYPAIYLLMYAEPRPGVKRPAAEASNRLLREHIRRVAAAGRLRMGEERAANLFHAAACGIVLTLLGMEEEHRDLRLSEIARDAALVAITRETPMPADSGPAAAAVTLHALLPGTSSLSEGERSLLGEWLDRIAAQGA